MHEHLRRAGGVLCFAPGAVVEQTRTGLRVAPLLSERFAWGRRYAVTRAVPASRAERLLRAITAILLPALLYLRIVIRHARGTPGRVVMATPALLLLLTAWSLGEGAGYLSGDP